VRLPQVTLGSTRRPHRTLPLGSFGAIARRLACLGPGPVISPSSRRSGPFDERDGGPSLFPLPLSIHSGSRSFGTARAPRVDSGCSFRFAGAEDEPEHRRPPDTLSRVAQGFVELPVLLFLPPRWRHTTVDLSLKCSIAERCGTILTADTMPSRLRCYVLSQTGRHSDYHLRFAASSWPSCHRFEAHITAWHPRRSVLSPSGPHA
jgi:hypothetical protein